MRRQHQERQPHITHCIDIVMRIIRTSIKYEQGKKWLQKAMRENAKEGSTLLRNCPNGMIRIVRGLKIDIKELKEEKVIKSYVSVRMREVKCGRMMMW